MNKKDMREYKCLEKNIFHSTNFSIEPIRDVDKMDIMAWRNEQIFHLRQPKPLTKSDQEKYFKNVITPSFNEAQPKQVLFSFLKNGQCIGYGGLVHINWVDHHAEISFIMNPELETNDFDSNWTEFLNLIDNVAFTELNLHKVFVYSFDLRPHLYTTLKKNHFFQDAILKEHCLYKEKFIDVVIYAKLSKRQS